MTGKKTRFLLLFLMGATACSTPRIILNQTKGKAPIRVNRNENIFVFTKDNLLIDNSLFLGTIATKHNGFTGKCNFRQVKKVAENRAKKIGGNLVIITKHKLPNKFLNPCHRIEGKIYAVPDPENYEKEIKWSTNRKLKITDFKGSTMNRPFVAATSSYFGYHTSVASKKNSFLIEIDAYFECESSYFKKGNHDGFNLNHEQLHFDITELYARKFLKKLHYEVTDFKDFLNKVETMGDAMNKELQLEQDAYDTDIYADISQQPKWDKKISEELKKLAPYENKKLGKPYRLRSSETK